MVKIQFNGKLASYAMLNGNIISLKKGYISPYYVEYTIDNSSETDTLGARNGAHYLYLPVIRYIDSLDYTIDFTDVEITLLDDTVVVDKDSYLDILVSRVKSIKLYYSNRIVSLKFDSASYESAHKINQLIHVNTSNMVDLNEMFRYCKSLTSVDLSNCNIRNVKYMGGMFFSCTSLTSINLSNLDSRNVVDMSFMFWNCSSLSSLNLTGFDTRKVTDATNMFIAVPSSATIRITESLWNPNMTESRTSFEGTFTKF